MSEPMKLNFFVNHPGEIAAGLHPYSETVSIEVESGDPGGDGTDFQEHMRDALVEWFDGAGVFTEEEFLEHMKHDVTPPDFHPSELDLANHRGETL